MGETIVDLQQDERTMQIQGERLCKAAHDRLAAEATAAPAKDPHPDLLAPLQHSASPCPAQSRPASKLSLPKARPVDRLKESAHER